MHKAHIKSLVMITKFPEINEDYNHEASKVCVYACVQGFHAHIYDPLSENQPSLSAQLVVRNTILKYSVDFSWVLCFA